MYRTLFISVVANSISGAGRVRKGDEISRHDQCGCAFDIMSHRREVTALTDM